MLASTGALLGAAGCSGEPRATASRRVVDVMKRASDFMRERCAVNGGYVWQYAADFSRRWGEMEAYPTMIWIQPPGTATIGHLFLDCYHATQDEYFYEAAEEDGRALAASQHPAGGWNYLHDFAGTESVRRWYDTIGRNGWRLEEFHHFYGNATFDDAGTIEAAQFLLRLFLEGRDDTWGEPFQRSMSFVLDSQYPSGGWPQRFPFIEDRPVLHGVPDYTRHITFNDDVAAQNIRFLLTVWQSLGEHRVLEALMRAMDVFLATQQPAPQAGWGSQHDAETLEPVGARSYEPRALTTHVTARNIGLLLDFFEWTAEERFLERVPPAIDWLESVRLPPEHVRMPGRAFPTYIEIGSNRPIYCHRRGSNVVNGAYYLDYSPEKPITHNAQWREIDVDALRERYGKLRAMDEQQLRTTSPLTPKSGFALPRLYLGPVPANVSADSLIDRLDDRGAWLTLLRMTSHPYQGEGPATLAPGDFTGSFVGDEYDTSPYFAADPEPGISTRTFVVNLATLAQSVAG